MRLGMNTPLYLTLIERTRRKGDRLLFEFQGLLHPFNQKADIRYQMDYEDDGQEVNLASFKRVYILKCEIISVEMLSV